MKHLVPLIGAERTRISKLRSVPALYSYQSPFHGNGYTAMRAVEKRNLSSLLPRYLNESADALATLAHQTPIRMQQNSDHCPEQTVSTIGARGRICGRMANELQYCCTARDLFSYWKSRSSWSEPQVALLDLLGTKKAMSKLSPAAKQRVQKLRCR
jgi:hypothetical protein